MLTPDQTRAFYNSWEEPDLYVSWSGLWRKQIKIVTNEGIFISLNNKTPRLNHHKLKKYAVKIAPIHIYARAYVPQAFDIPHYILSCDVTRVMTLPETLNGETGLICTAYNPDQFMDRSIEEIINQAKGAKHITAGANWQLATEWKNSKFNLLRSP